MLSRLLRLDTKRLRLFVFALGLFMGLLSVFVLWRAQNVVMRFDDPYGFAKMGQNIAEGRGFAQPDKPDLPTMRRAPLYPALIAALYFLSGGPHPLLIQLLQAVFVGGICLLAFEIGRIVFSTKVGLVAGVTCAFHPMVLRYAPDIQVENFFTFLTTLMVWTGVRFVSRPSMANGAAVGAAGAAAALVKGVVVLCPPLFAVFWLYRQWRKERRPSVAAFGNVAAMAIAMAAVILPWTARNYAVTGGHFVLISTNAGGEFLRGYVFAQPKYYLLEQRPYVEGELEANQMEIDLFAGKGLVWGADETETELVLNASAKEKFRGDPLAFVRKFVAGIFMFWYVLTSRANSLLVGALAFASWALALVGFREARREGRETWPLFLPIFVVNLMYASILALGRYSAPCIPTLTVLAASGLVALANRRKGSAGGFA